MSIHCKTFTIITVVMLSATALATGCRSRVVEVEVTTTPAAMLSSPGNGEIAFYSERDGNDEIYVLDPDGDEQGAGNLRRLTDNDAGEKAPAFSPDASLVISGGYDHVVYVWGIPR